MKVYVHTSNNIKIEAFNPKLKSFIKIQYTQK